MRRKTDIFKIQSSNFNKNTLPGQVNCKKTTKHHAHLSLCAKSRETKNVKLRKWPKTSVWAIFFDDFEAKYLEVANFSEKQVSFKLKVIFSANFRPKSEKAVRAVFEKNIKVFDFGLI